MQPDSPEALFFVYRTEVSGLIDRYLADTFATVSAEARACGLPVLHAVEALRHLTLRGGKRLRATLLAVAYEACGGEGGPKAVLSACAALEVLHSGLLIHDDWMDQDLLRRGGPSVHAQLRGLYPREHVADASAVLAGDYAFFLAQKLLLSLSCPPATLREAAQLLAQTQQDVVFGQLLDLHAHTLDRDTLERMHALKTGSYTVCGPLLLGAMLAGGTEAQRQALLQIAHPLGVAFQLRDDLLGTFGDPLRTGKSSEGDWREGKRTALVLALEASSPLEAPASQEEGVDAMRRRMVQSGAKKQVEERLALLVQEALACVQQAPFSRFGGSLLSGAVVAFGYRED